MPLATAYRNVNYFIVQKIFATSLRYLKTYLPIYRKYERMIFIADCFFFFFIFFR